MNIIIIIALLICTAIGVSSSVFFMGARQIVVESSLLFCVIVIFAIYFIRKSKLVKKKFIDERTINKKEKPQHELDKLAYEFKRDQQSILIADAIVLCSYLVVMCYGFVTGYY
ncbi:MAG: hypothetical protein R3Y05_00910 [bacterium]